MVKKIGNKKVDKKKKPLVISLVGMSCSGKSRWSKKLAESGFDRICCDDLIEKVLAKELKKCGACGIEDVANWMGHPYEERSPRNQQMYLDAEIKIMKKILEKLKKGVKRNTVIDTTGSVIYTGDKILKELRKYSLVIYMETPASMLPEMFRRFIEKPKPVFWGDKFSKCEDETEEQALVRCYPKLLHYRRGLYKKNSDVILRYAIRRAEDFTEEKFIQFAEKAMGKNKL